MHSMHHCQIHFVRSLAYELIAGRFVGIDCDASDYWQMEVYSSPFRIKVL